VELMCYIWCVWVGRWNGTVEVENLGLCLKEQYGSRNQSDFCAT
jgi:hypothetical protein